MIAELLRDLPGTARATEHPDGLGDRLTNVARAGLIRRLQPRHEEGISLESVDSEIGHSMPPGQSR